VKGISSGIVTVDRSVYNMKGITSGIVTGDR
jgi:hypothetical protein